MNLHRIKKALCTLSGDDYSIISRCHANLQVRFALIGLFVASISLLCFVSSYFTFKMLFDQKFVAIILGLVFALMITTIYLLLLYTLSKNVLPHKAKIGASEFSILIRVLFISFIAIVVSKPVERMLFSIPLEVDLAEYRSIQISKYEKITENSFNGDILEIKQRIKDHYRLNGYESDDIVKDYEQQLLDKEQQKRRLVFEMKKLVSRSNYYTQSLILLNSKHSSCWLVTLMIVLIFISPAYLKYLVSKHSNFSSFRKEIEMQMVLDEYAQFKRRYSAKLSELFQMDVEYTECYTDPPFNTIKKVDNRSFQTEADLISDLYSG